MTRVLFEDSILTVSDKKRTRSIIQHLILQSSWNHVLAILASFCPDGLLIWGVMLHDGILQWRGAHSASVWERAKQM